MQKQEAGFVSGNQTAKHMHLVKVRKRIFKREFLDYRLVVVVFDVYEISKEEENTVIEVNRIFWVMPMIKGMEIDDKEKKGWISIDT